MQQPTLAELYYYEGEIYYDARPYFIFDHIPLLSDSIIYVDDYLVYPDDDYWQELVDYVANWLSRFPEFERPTPEPYHLVCELQLSAWCPHCQLLGLTSYTSDPIP